MRFRRFDIDDHVPTGECSITTMRCDEMVMAAAIAHWQDDMLERLKCTTSAPRWRRACRVRHMSITWPRWRSHGTVR